MWKNSKKRQEAAQNYGTEVAEVLEKVGGFEFDKITRDIIVTHVAAQHLEPTPTFELIIDHPGTANWRLKNRRGHPIWLSDYAYISTEARQDRQDAVNNAICMIDNQHEPNCRRHPSD